MERGTKLYILISKVSYCQNYIPFISVLLIERGGAIRVIFNITFIILNIISFSIAPHLVYNEQKNINEYINIPLLKKSLLQNRFEQFAQKYDFQKKMYMFVRYII